jgi:hypothetical protein
LDPVDHAEEEQKILLKQQVMFKIAETMPVSDETLITVFKDIVKEVKSKTVGDVDGVYSQQFGEASKRNAGRLIELAAITRADGGAILMRQLVTILCAKIRKHLKVLQSMENKKTTRNLKLKDYICFLIKSLEDAIRKLSIPNMRELILALKKDIIEVICTTAECEDVLVRNQAQILFTFVLQKIM